jgi:hypothetical protein
MKGFHPTFVDIVDFVLRLTHWMYSSDLKVVVPVLCENYYADKCTIHTPGQEIIGRQAIIDETQECKSAIELLWCCVSASSYYLVFIVRVFLSLNLVFAFIAPSHFTRFLPRMQHSRSFLIKSGTVKMSFGVWRKGYPLLRRTLQHTTQVSWLYHT